MIFVLIFQQTNQLKTNKTYITHYEGQRKCDEILSKLPEKTKAKILNPKSDHEKYQEKHIKRHTIPNDIDD